MKTEYWIIVIALLLLTALGGMMGMNTVIAEQQADLTEMDSLRAETYWTRIAAMPKPYSLPLEQLWISSGTGYRQDPLGGVDAEEKLHDGIDLAAREGTPVYAVMSGVVVTHYVPPDGKKWKGHPVYGGMLEIESEPGLLWRFGHLKTTLVHEDDFVKQGQKIGLVGSTGMSTAPHLHLQVIVSPMKYLEERR